jgi:hypothetical protein
MIELHQYRCRLAVALLKCMESAGASRGSSPTIPIAKLEFEDTHLHYCREAFGSWRAHSVLALGK